MENRSKGIIIILSVLLVIVGVVAVYLGISLSDMEVIVDNLENEVVSNENKQTSDKIQVNEENVVNESTEIQLDKVQNSAKSTTYKMIDVSNNLNEDMYLSKQYNNVKTKIINNKAYVAFTTNSIGTANYTKELNKYYEISGVDGKVVDMSIIQIPTSGYPIFVMLMSDGTLQKTKFVQGSDIVCDGKIHGYENIVRIDDVEIANMNQFGDDVSIQYSKGIVVTNTDGKTELLKNLY